MEEKIKSDFFIALSQRVCDLKQQGIHFILLSFCPKSGNSLEVGLVKNQGDDEKKFKLTFDEKGIFFLENEEYRKKGGRPALQITDMVDYILVLVNGSQIYGTLMVPGHRRFKHLETISPT